MSSVLEFVIRAKDSASDVVESVRSKISRFGSSLGGELLNAAGWASAAVTAIKLIGDSIREAFDVQRMTAQFQSLLGSLDAAKERMAELKEFKMGDGEGLFKLPDIGKASQSLHVLTDDLIGGTDGLKLIGDAATATNNSMESVAFAVGKAFGDIKEGLPIDRAIMQLQSLSLIGPDAIKVLKELDNAGASQIKKWNALSGALEKYNGAMANMAKTDAGKLTKDQAELHETKQNIGAAVAHAGAILIENVDKFTLPSLIIGLMAKRAKKKMQPILDARDKNQSAQQKIVSDKKVADAFSKTQKEIDERAEAARQVEQQKKADAAKKEWDEIVRENNRSGDENAKAQKSEDERKAKAKAASDQREAGRAARERVEDDAKAKTRGLEEQIKALGDAAESAARRLQTAKTWLADFGGRAQGEWGERGNGRREWAKGAADARATNERKAKEDKLDWSRLQELQGRVARGTKLSKGDAQWVEDQQDWMARRNATVKDAKQAAADQAQALADQKALELAKLQVAMDTNVSCRNIERTLQENLQAP